jgi:hypothetical protein
LSLSNRLFQALNHRFVDSTSPDSMASRARDKRNQILMDAFPELSSMRVLDIGGRPDYWQHVPVQPREVVLLNLESPSPPAESWLVTAHGDACELPDEIAKEAFDLVFSNSTIEHVGGHYRRQQFAASVRSFGCSYWIQTPNRYFPIEPHFMLPALQFLPISARVWVAKRSPAVAIYGKHMGDIDAVLEIELIGKTEMKSYFPESTIVSEKFLGLPKSVVAVYIHR